MWCGELAALSAEEGVCLRLDYTRRTGRSSSTPVRLDAQGICQVTASFGGGGPTTTNPEPQGDVQPIRSANLTRTAATLTGRPADVWRSGVSGSPKEARRTVAVHTSATGIAILIVFLPDRLANNADCPTKANPARLQIHF